MKRLFRTETFQWKRYCSFLLLFFVLALQKPVQAQQFANVSLYFVGGTDNYDCNCGDGGTGCPWPNIFNSQPDSRWRLAAKLNTEAGYPSDIIKKYDNVNCGAKTWSPAEALSKTSVCASAINIRMQSWEDDGCNSDEEFNTGGGITCPVNQDDHWSGVQTFNLNYQSYTQNTDHDITYTMSNGYTAVVRLRWSAVSGYSAPALESTNLQICSSLTGTLHVTSVPTGSNTFRWYSNAALTNVIGTGTTINVSTAGTYYVAQWDGSCNGSANSATVTVVQSPAAPTTPATVSACLGKTVNITATNNSSGSTLQWYNASTAIPANLIGTGASISYTVNGAATIYVRANDGSCTSNMVAVNITLSASPNPPIVNTPVSTCLGGQPVLTASTGGADGIFNWYTTSSGGSPVWNGEHYQTPAINASTTFYVSEVDGGGCESSRSAIVVNPDLTLTTPTASASPEKVCPGGSTTITANSNGGDIYWYSDETLTNLLFIGNPYTPQNIGDDVTYYFVEKQSSCISNSGSVDVLLNSAPAAPTGITADTACFGTQTVIRYDNSVNPLGTVVSLYGDASGNIALQTSTSQHVQFLITPTTQYTNYYIGLNEPNSTCKSPLTIVRVVAKPLIEAPTVENLTFCANEDVILSATPIRHLYGVPGDLFYGYPETGSIIFMQNDLGIYESENYDFSSTPSMPVNYNAGVWAPGTYTVGVFNLTTDGCSSSYSTFNVTVLPEVAAPYAEDVEICQGGRDLYSLITSGPSDVVTLQATGDEGSVVTWYDDDNGNHALNVGELFTLSSNLTPGTYTFYVGQSVNGCKSPLTPVNLTIYPQPSALSVTPFSQTVCYGGNAEMELDLDERDNSFFIWTIDPSIIAPGNIVQENPFITMPITGTQSYYFIEVNEFGCVADEQNWGVAVASSYDPVVVNASAEPACVNEPIDISIAHWEYEGEYVIVDYSGNPVSDYFHHASTDSGITHVQIPGISTPGSYSYAVAEVAYDGEYSICPSLWSTFIVKVQDKSSTPTAESVTVCPGESATLTASCGNSGGEIRWYNGYDLSELIHVGSTLMIPDVSNSPVTFFAVTCTAPNACESDPVYVGADVGSSIGIILLNSNSPVCEGGDIVLTATRVKAGNIIQSYVDDIITYKWYGPDGTLLGTTTDVPSFTINNANPGMSGIYKVIAYANDDSTSCIVPATTTVIVNGEAQAPSTKGATICEGQSVRLTAYGEPGAILTWYSDETLTQAIQVGAEYITPALSSTTTYYVAQSGACTSTATAVTVNVHEKPETPVSSEGFYVTCWDDYTVLYASNSNGDEIHWYMDPDGKDDITGWFGYDGNGEFTTPELTSFTRYYFDAVDPETGCHSDMSFVDVYTTPQIQAPRVDDVTICDADNTITLTAHVPIPLDLITDFYDVFTFNYGIVQFLDNTGTEYGPLSTIGLVDLPLDPWYYGYEATAQVTIPRFGVGPLGESYNYSAPGTYDIGAILNSSWYNLYTDDEFFCHSDAGSGTLTIKGISDAPTAKGVTVCDGENATMTANCDGEIRWYSDRTLTDLLHIGSTMPVLAPAVGTITYFATCTIQGSCESPATPVNLTVVPKPSAITLSSNSPVCEGGDIVLTATQVLAGDVTYTWYNPKGEVLGTTSEPTFTILSATPDNSGTYSVSVTIGSGDCSTTATTQVLVKPTPAAPSVDEAVVVCEGGNVSVCATSKVIGAVFTWSGPNGFMASGNCISLTNITQDQGGAYNVIVTLDGCTSQPATVNVIVNPRPTAEVSSNSPICEHSTLELTATIPPSGDNPYSFKWSGPNGFTSTEQNPSIENVTEVDHQGFYTLILTDENTQCASKPISTLVEINTFPDRVVAVNNGPVCEGGSITLTATKVFGAHYSWSGPGLKPYETDYPVTSVTLDNVSPTQSGTYTVTITLSETCSETATTDVVVWANPIADAGQDTSVTQGSLLQLLGTSHTTSSGQQEPQYEILPGITFNWTPDEYLNHNNIPNPLFFTDEMPERNPYPIVFTIWDKNGCMDKDTVEITILPATELNIPDIITPNGDGLNDTWIIDHIDYLNKSGIAYTVQIYARGGALLYSTNHYDNSNGFDGTYKGTTLPDGAYWFVITTPEKTYKGALHIKR